MVMGRKNISEDIFPHSSFPGNMDRDSWQDGYLIFFENKLSLWGLFLECKEFLL